MKLVVINGSSRNESQSIKVAKWLRVQLEILQIEVDLIDLAKFELPIRHDDIWDELDNAQHSKKLRAILDSADGFVVVSPEWNGMASPALKNLFLYTAKTMADKPSLIVAVSASRGGSYPIAELRMSGYKNTRIVYLPEQLIIRDVKNVLNDKNPASETDEYIRKRALYCLAVLLEYSQALKQVRNSGVLDYKSYPNGM